MKYDFIIIGAGLSGLECATILSKEGYSVCVLEQGIVIGGCLQSFKRDGVFIDTGMHYIGSMDEGQIMRQYLKYFGISDKLQTIRLDDDFDHINLNGDAEYCYRSGYDNFAKQMIEYFPHERDGIKRYCSVLQNLGSSINIDVHRQGKLSLSNLDSLSLSAVQFIEECVEDPILRSILAGTNALYGANRGSANLYHHAMINHSNIEGAHRCIGASYKVADLLHEQIIANGGVVKTKSKVVRLTIEANRVSDIVLEDGSTLSANNVISTLHPASTFEMIDTAKSIKQAYRTRLNLLPNTYGIFTVNLVLQPNSTLYQNKNYYLYGSNDTWNNLLHSHDLKPNAILLSSQLETDNSKFSSVISLMALINNGVFDQHKDSQFGKRSEEYKSLKSRITNNIVEYVLRFNPELKGKIKSIYSSSPLTYQHYTMVPEGSAYGLLKSYKNSISTIIPSHTKLDNLYLSSQNSNVHGAIGVTLAAAATCACFLGEEYLAKKIAKV